jgi:hypothetical protein
MVAALLDAGADVNGDRTHRWTRLMRAARESRHRRKAAPRSQREDQGEVGQRLQCSDVGGPLGICRCHSRAACGAREGPRRAHGADIRRGGRLDSDCERDQDCRGEINPSGGAEPVPIKTPEAA